MRAERAPVDDDALGDAGRLVHRLGHRGAVDEILVADRAVDLGEDRTGVGIPLGDALAALDLVALVDLEPGAVLQAVHRALGPVGPDDDDRDVAAHDDQVAIRVAGDVAVADLHRALEVGLDEGLVGDLRRAADVEGAHGELRARLADRLRRDDADRFAEVDRRAAGEIAPVAGGADAVLRLADQHGADLHLLDAGGRDAPRYGCSSIIVPCGTMTVPSASTRSSAVVRPRMRERERGDHLAGIDDGAHPDAALGAAIRPRG